MSRDNNDHAELRGLCDKWVQWVQETGEMLAAHPNDLAGRIAWNHQRLMASELRPLLAPALDELDRLRAELDQRKADHMEDVGKCSGTINELRAEVERLKPELSEMTRRMTELACELTPRLVLEAERKGAIAQMVEALKSANEFIGSTERTLESLKVFQCIEAALEAAKAGQS